MRPKSALKKLDPLLKEVSFTSEDAHACGVSSATLNYYVRVGGLERIGRGAYRGPQAPKIQDFRWADLIEAVKRSKDGVVCLTSALAIYDLTDEIPRQHWIAIRHETGHRAEPSTKVIRMRNTELGRTTTKLSNVTIPIFDRERTIIDAFRYLSRETALKALKSAVTKRGKDKIDLEKLRRYSRTLRVKIEPYVLAITT